MSRWTYMQMKGVKFERVKRHTAMTLRCTHVQIPLLVPSNSDLRESRKRCCHSGSGIGKGARWRKNTRPARGTGNKILEFANSLSTFFLPWYIVHHLSFAKRLWT